MIKKITLVLISSFLSFTSMQSKAETYMIEVEDFEFNPAVLNVNIGDTIIWFWHDGIHTTTSTLIPSGAASWDAAIADANPVFIYIPTVAGSYDYQCSFHSSLGMLGHFTVASATTVNDLAAFERIKFQNPILSDRIRMNFADNKGEIKIQVMSLTGEIARRFSATGTGEKIFPVDGLVPGIYILNVISGTHARSYRLIKEN